MGWSKKNGVWNLHREPGCIFAFNPAHLVTLNSGNVSSWGDLCAFKSAPLVNSDSNLQPLFVSSDSNFGGRPSIYFGNGRYLRVIWGSSVAQPFTYYVAAKLAKQTASAVLVDNVSGVSAALYNNSNQTRIYADSAEIPLGTTNASACVYAIEFNGANSKAFINSSATNLISGNPGTQTLRGLTVGINTLLNAATIANSWVAGLYGFSGSHSAGYRAEIMGRLGCDLNIATS